MTEPKGSNFWSTLPGLVTALAGMITAIAILVTTLATLPASKPRNERAGRVALGQPPRPASSTADRRRPSRPTVGPDARGRCVADPAPLARSSSMPCASTRMTSVDNADLYSRRSVDAASSGA